jgi:hypothetical protein
MSMQNVSMGNTAPRPPGVASGAGTTTTLTTDGERARSGRIDWGAVIAGVALLVAATLVLNMLGVGIGVSTADPLQPGETPSAAAFGIGGAIWWVVSNWIAVGIGAFFAGRLAHRMLEQDGGLHGLTVWAIGLILTMTLFASVAGAIGGTVTRALGTSVQVASQQADDRNLVDRLTAPADGQGDLQAELRRFVADPKSVDRNRIVDLIAQQAQIDRTEADRRLTEAENQARQAADAAATVVGQTAIWGVVALLIGAIVSYFAGGFGARSNREARERRVVA